MTGNEQLILRMWLPSSLCFGAVPKMPSRRRVPRGGGGPADSIGVSAAGDQPGWNASVSARGEGPGAFYRGGLRAPRGVAPTASSTDLAGKLYLGENLGFLHDFPTASVDLVYLDPPYNSSRRYNVLFTDKSGLVSDAQRGSFRDTWRWGPSSEAHFAFLTETSRHGGRVPPQLGTYVSALRAAFEPIPRLDGVYRRVVTDLMGTHAEHVCHDLPTIRLGRLHTGPILRIAIHSGAATGLAARLSSQVTAWLSPAIGSKPRSE